MLGAGARAGLCAVYSQAGRVCPSLLLALKVLTSDPEPALPVVGQGCLGSTLWASGSILTGGGIGVTCNSWSSQRPPVPVCSVHIGPNFGLMQSGAKCRSPSCGPPWSLPLCHSPLKCCCHIYQWALMQEPNYMFAGLKEPLFVLMPLSPSKLNSV